MRHALRYKKHPPLTADRLREMLHYDPDTGVFVWRDGWGWGRRRRAQTTAGKAGNRGYVIVGIDGQKYLAHRLAWLYVYGCWPSAQLDHKDLDRKNNRIANLRLSTGTLNQANTRKPRTNKSGVKGVSWDAVNRVWRAAIRKGGQGVNLGRYATREAAAAAYEKAAGRLFGQSARTDDA